MRKMKSNLLAVSLLAGAVAVVSPMSAWSAEQSGSTASSVKTAVSDSVITTKIKASMAKDKQVSATSIKVETDDKGAVHLSGTAKSRAEAERAVQIARATEGVKSVRNDIRIETN